MCCLFWERLGEDIAGIEKDDHLYDRQDDSESDPCVKEWRGRIGETVQEHCPREEDAANPSAPEHIEPKLTESLR